MPDSMNQDQDWQGLPTKTRPNWLSSGHFHATLCIAIHLPLSLRYSTSPGKCIHLFFCCASWCVDDTECINLFTWHMPHLLCLSTQTPTEADFSSHFTFTSAAGPDGAERGSGGLEAGMRLDSLLGEHREPQLQVIFCKFLDSSKCNVMARVE